jgi:hypothetical protein
MASNFTSLGAIPSALSVRRVSRCKNQQPLPLLVLLLLACCSVNSYPYVYGYMYSCVLPSNIYSNSAYQRQQDYRPASCGGWALFDASSDKNDGTAQSNDDSAECDTGNTELGVELFLDEFGHPIEEKRIDYVGAGTLGDIMSSDEGFRFSALDQSVLEQPSSDGAAAPAEALDTAGDTTTDIDEEKTYDAGTLFHDEGLVTTAGGTLQARFGAKIPSMSPFERIALTSNGNLQRIFSSYYDAPVHVHVNRCEMRNSNNEGVNDDDDREDSGSSHDLFGDFELGIGGCSKNQNRVFPSANSEPASGDAVWDREVHLSVHSQTFCRARSVVTVRSDDCIRLVHSGEVGIGQLFRYLDRLPTFEILDAGRRLDDGGMWRTYTLECRELSCVIREDFVSNAWALEPNSVMNELNE